MIQGCPNIVCNFATKDRDAKVCPLHGLDLIQLRISEVCPSCKKRIPPDDLKLRHLVFCRFCASALPWAEAGKGM